MGDNKMKLNKKVTLGASALVLGATLIGGTMAWLTSEETIVNKFSTKSWDLEVDLEEDFEEDEAQELLPGAVIKKDGWVENNKDLPVLVRVHIEQVWGDHRLVGHTTEGERFKVVINQELTDAAIAANVAMIDTAHSPETVVGEDYFSENWELIGDYYYYKHVLVPGDKTDNVISDVTINPDLTVDQHKQFGGKVFDINLKAEAVQIENDAYLSAWEIGQDDRAAVEKLVGDALNEYSTPEVPEETPEQAPSTPDAE